MPRSPFPELESWKADRRDAKLHNVLGLTEADLKEARNQSISSSSTTKIHYASLSDATTAIDRSPPYHATTNVGSRKGSDVVTQPVSEYSPVMATTTPSIPKTYNSSSTLHYYYEVHNPSLARSPQHLNHSSQSFPLHETGSITSTRSPDSFWGLKLFKSSSSSSPKSTKKLSRARPPTSRTLPPEPTTPADWPREADKLPLNRPKSVRSTANTIRSRDGLRLNPPTPTSSPPPVPKTPKTSRYNAALAVDPACVKVNIRRPKAGVKYWFDGLEGDSSEDEDFDEPEFQHNFVLGIENAFQDDKIKASSCTQEEPQNAADKAGDSNPVDYANPTPRKPAVRIAVLNAKSSKANLSTTQPQPRKPESSRFEQLDLTEQSVLDLSSDEEAEEEEEAEAEASAVAKIEAAFSVPGLRDSVATDSNVDSTEELSTAKTILVQSKLKPVEVVRVRRQSEDESPSRNPSLRTIPKRGSSLALAGRPDHRHQGQEESDLLAAFPATPVESASIRSSTAFPSTPADSVAASFNASIRNSVALSTAGSLDSRRLMSVTRQEESLLAAMRLKKAAMKYNSSQTKPPVTSNSLEATQSPTFGSMPDPQLHVSAQRRGRPNLASRRRGPSPQIKDGTSSQVSGTTFELMTPPSASHISKPASLAESTSAQLTRLSLSSSTHSGNYSVTPSLRSGTATNTRQSYETDISAPTAGNDGKAAGGGHHRTLTVNSHVVALDDLDQPPKRDLIPSQEFIDWPYKGWDTRLELGLAR